MIRAVHHRTDGMSEILRAEEIEVPEGHAEIGVCVGYLERREDGWPLCPKCGDDELYSLAIPATEATIEGCYACGWKQPRDASVDGQVKP